MNTGTTQLTPLLGMTLGQLQEVVAALGMPRFSAGQICRWLYVKCATSIDEMTDLSKTAVTDLISRKGTSPVCPEKADFRSRYLLNMFLIQPNMLRLRNF